MNNIYLIDYGLSGNFFIRVANSSPELRHHFISIVWSSSKEAKKRGYTSSLLSKWRCCDLVCNEKITETREVLLGVLDETRAIKLFSLAYAEVINYARKNKVDPQNTILHIWNGASVFGEVARKLKNDFGFKTLFYEISNLPGKLFVDPDGVNAQARIYSTPEILSRFPDTNGFFPVWRNSFFDLKRDGVLIPQAITSKSLNLNHFCDFIYAIIWGFRFFSWTSVRTKILNLLRVRNGFKINVGAHTDSSSFPESFLFFPMQVSNDTQIKINSHINNVDALEYLAQTCDLPLLIKPHPAEFDTTYLYDAIDRLQFKHKPRVTDINTVTLIKKARKVYTINSTVGLEALILGKPVEFLAKSFYSNLNEDNLPNYVVGYLLSIDFFAESEAISSKAYSLLVDRALL